MGSLCTWMKISDRFQINGLVERQTNSAISATLAIALWVIFHVSSSVGLLIAESRPRTKNGSDRNNFDANSPRIGLSNKLVATISLFHILSITTHDA